MNFIETPKLTDELPNIAIYGSHNSNIAIEHKGKILEVIELERFYSEKNAGLCQYNPMWARKHAIPFLLSYIEERYGFTMFGTVLYQNTDVYDSLNDDDNLQPVGYHNFIPGISYIEMNHHEAHAAGSFYQSSFDKAICISFDGGGNDGFFRVFYCEREKGLSHIRDFDIDLGFPYMVFGEYIDEIRREPALENGNLVYAGKILGYQSYGKVDDALYPHMMKFYLSKPKGETYKKLLQSITDNTEYKLDEENRLKEMQSANLAATSQKAFEDIFFELVDGIIRQYDVPICLSGGCALNIVLNTKVKERYGRPVFVGPNPNDCGLAAGMLLHCLKPAKAVDVSYLGVPILDRHTLARQVESRRAKLVSVDFVVNELVNEKIIGVVQGNSEHGPRALGNRSIICSPLEIKMKDMINEKIKHREFYRPFAPIVRLEDVSEYFQWYGPSEFMNFCPRVKSRYVYSIPAVTHIDKTARVQTITKDKNPLMYEMLTLFKERTGIGVLLNTSFNVNGKPILSTYSEAFEVFDKTELDGLYLDGFYFKK